MLPSDPSWLITTGISLDLLQDHLKRKSKEPDATRLWVEWQAWGMLLAVYWTLPLLHRFAFTASSNPHLEEAIIEQKHRPQSNEISIISLLSVCLVGARFLSESDHDKRDWLLPIITTVVLIAVLTSRALRPVPGSSWAVRFHSSGGSVWSLLVTALASTTVSIISAWIIVSYTPQTSININLPGLCFFLSQCSVYFTLWRINVAIVGQSHAPSTSEQHILRRLSLQSFVLCTVLLAVSGERYLKIHATLLIMGTIRAVYYFLVFTLCLRHSPLTIVSATTLPTIITAIGQSLQDTSFDASLSGSLVALAALFQNFFCLPSSASHRKLLFLTMLLPGYLIVQRSQYMGSLGSHLTETLATPDLHPIEKLAAAGQAEFSHLLTSQSNALGKAVAEYIRRYKRAPPRNFDKWFEIAEGEGYVLFDEFDAIMETLEPFWAVTPAELRSRVDAAFENPSLIRFSISNALISFDHGGSAPWIARQVQSWLPPDWRRLLENMTFAVNLLDEPRVLVPFENLTRVLGYSKTTKNATDGTPTWEKSGREEAEPAFLKIGKQSAWQEMASACSDQSPALVQSHVHGRDRVLDFVANVTDCLDVCLQPELHKKHGFFVSPDSLDITHSLVPIFSQGKPSIFNDILFPSPYYAGKMDQREYVDEDDPPWTSKADTLYWSGATTGGYATMSNWESLHRQRLLLSLNPQSQNLATLLNETSPGQRSQYSKHVSELQPLFSLKMVGTAQCDPEACDAQRAAFNITPFDDGAENPNMDPLKSTYQAKYTLDMDGNGFSGRYYRLLKSRSAVVKQTIFKEWHDGHLVPWVHYIPLSMNGDELPEIMRYFNEDIRGKELGERIARESRSWANITLRKIDLQLAFLRLLLEYGRLMSDERDTLFYEA